MTTAFLSVEKPSSQLWLWVCLGFHEEFPNCGRGGIARSSAARVTQLGRISGRWHSGSCPGSCGQADACWGGKWVCALEASPPGSSLQGSCAGRSSPKALQKSPCTYTRVLWQPLFPLNRWLEVEWWWWWRWSDAASDSGTCYKVASQASDLQEDYLLRNTAPNEPCGWSVLWTRMTHKDGHLQQPSIHRLLTLLSQRW